MVMELGSVAPTQGARRSTRIGHGSGGRDVQLNRLGELLVAPTYQAKKCFAPTDGLSLPKNLLAPVQKKRCKGKKVYDFLFIGLR
jgi:hypothetical protein